MLESLSQVGDRLQVTARVAKYSELAVQQRRTQLSLLV